MSLCLHTCVKKTLELKAGASGDELSVRKAGATQKHKINSPDLRSK